MVLFTIVSSFIDWNAAKVISESELNWITRLMIFCELRLSRYEIKGRNHNWGRKNQVKI